INLENVEAGVPKVAQQIDVVNRGNLTATKIQIKLAKHVEKITIKKDSQEDNVNQHNIPSGGEEVDYSSLQPTGRFTLTIINSDPLNDNDLDVRDDSGRARSALVDTDNIVSSSANVALWLIMLFYVLSFSQSLRKGLLFNKARSNPFEILKTRRPFFLSDALWKEIIEEAIDHIDSSRANSDTYDTPSSWQLYKLLNGDKPEDISDVDWSKALSNVQKALNNRLLTKASLAHTSRKINSITEILKVHRPKNFEEPAWKDLQAKLVEIYHATLLSKVLQWRFDYQEIIKAISAVQSTDCDEAIHKSDLECFLKIYKAALVEDAINSHDPANFSASIDVSLLNGKDLKVIKEFAYFLQVRQILSINTVMDAKSFLKSPRPEILNDADYRLLRNLAETIIQVDTQEQDVQRKDANLAKEAAETQKLKAKILNQLNFINDFIENPNVIDKIEEYENIFAPGNMENLRKMAVMLKSVDH
ncbi:MAG: hypothetical protein ABSB19_12875, partial [Methylomonas sp.]